MNIRYSLPSFLALLPVLTFAGKLKLSDSLIQTSSIISDVSGFDLQNEIVDYRRFQLMLRFSSIPSL